MYKKTKKKPGSAKKKIIKKKKCVLCESKRDMFNYKETAQLENFLSEKGKILPQKFSGMCAKHQRELAKVIKRARHAGLMAFEISL
ncbi:MAG: 30S ribosomal protein S18 [Candidatus Omnitrophica bacterium]|nr:30S ribosomal protein S18 [Candidatus Omnitrophota bacterium]